MANKRFCLCLLQTFNILCQIYGVVALNVAVAQHS